MYGNGSNSLDYLSASEKDEFEQKEEHVIVGLENEDEVITVEKVLNRSCTMAALEKRILLDLG